MEGQVLGAVGLNFDQGGGGGLLERARQGGFERADRRRRAHRRSRNSSAARANFIPVWGGHVLLERVALGGHREEVEDAAAVVVDQHDRERQPVATRGQQAADVVQQRRRRRSAALPVRPPAAAAPNALETVPSMPLAPRFESTRGEGNAGREEQLDVADRHRGGDEHGRLPGHPVAQQRRASSGSDSGSPSVLPRSPRRRRRRRRASAPARPDPGLRGLCGGQGQRRVAILVLGQGAVRVLAAQGPLVERQLSEVVGSSEASHARRGFDVGRSRRSGSPARASPSRRSRGRAGAGRSARRRPGSEPGARQRVGQQRGTPAPFGEAGQLRARVAAPGPTTNPRAGRSKLGAAARQPGARQALDQGRPFAAGRDRILLGRQHVQHQRLAQAEVQVHGTRGGRRARSSRRGRPARGSSAGSGAVARRRPRPPETT